MNSQVQKNNDLMSLAFFIGGALLLSKFLPRTNRSRRFAKVDKKIRKMLAEEEKNTTPFPKAIDMEPRYE